MLEDDRLRRRLLSQVPDPQIQALWRTYFNPLDRRFRAEIINPVQTKTYKFAANLTARAIVGQSRSTIDPLSWVRDGAVVVVDVAKEQVGADIAAMIGGTLINLLALAIGHQAGLQPSQRRQVALLVDEFHALPAANYEAFLAELAKYGASLVLATQSLGALDEVDPGRGLRHAQRDGALLEWRNAAACARGRMRPDGYGLLRLGRREYGFFLEFDRGTVHPAALRAKFAAYHRYRSSARARDYDGFPTILVITTGPGGEQRIVDVVVAVNTAYAASLPVFVTTIGWIAADADGMLGRIWLRPGTTGRLRWPSEPDGIERARLWSAGGPDGPGT